MSLRSINVDDYIEFAAHKATLNDPTVYVYGKVNDIDKFGVLTVDLSEPYDGDSEMRIPDYLARKITEQEYRKETTKYDLGSGILAKEFAIGSGGQLEMDFGYFPPEIKGCQHKWEITGCSPLTGLNYENCKSCKIKREDV